MQRIPPLRTEQSTALLRPTTLNELDAVGYGPVEAVTKGVTTRADAELAAEIEHWRSAGGSRRSQASRACPPATRAADVVDPRTTRAHSDDMFLLITLLMRALALPGPLIT